LKISTYIAQRFVVPKRFTFITLIGVVSVIGITIGTAALIVVMSIFNGFRDVAYNLMVGFGPHARIVAVDGRGLSGANSIATQVSQKLGDELEFCFAVQQTSAVIQLGGRTGVGQVIGVRASDASKLAGPAKAVFAGKFDISSSGGTHNVVISAGIAESVQLYIGDTIKIFSPEMIEQAITTMAMPRGVACVVSGIYQSNTSRDVDNTQLYGSYELATALSHSAMATAVYVNVKHPIQIEEINEEIAMLVPSGTRLETWKDLNQSLVQTMKLEGIGSFLVLALIVLVAAFNVLVSLTLGVVEKQRDIGMLKIMGLTDSEIRRIYIVQGLVIGVCSVGVGIALGLGLCYGQQAFSWISFDVAEGFLVPSLPIHVHISDVLATAAVGLILATGAAIYPATRAAKTVVAEAIRTA